MNHLQALHSLQETYLVGGTALALLLGHRKSIDLDLFGHIVCDSTQLENELSGVGKVTILKDSSNIHVFSIENVKVDIVNYPYNWIGYPIHEDNLKIASLDDICAMKLAAITGRGTRKDFIDIYFLAKHFNLTEMRCLYEKKYPHGSWFLVMKSLTYFADAEAEPMPIMLTAIDWNKLKEEILEFVSQ